MFTFHLLSTYAVWQTHPQKVQLWYASNARVLYFYSSSDGLSPSHSDYIANTVIDKYTVW